MKYIAVLLGLFSGAAFACKCEPSSTDPAQAFDKHEIVALVQICEAHLEKKENAASVIATGGVIDTFKGSYNGKFTLDAGSPNSNCHTPIAVGRTYLVFGNKKGLAYLGHCQPSGEPQQIGYEYMRSIQHLSSNNSGQRDAEKRRACR